MPFKVCVYEVDEQLFLPEVSIPSRQRRERAAAAKASSGEDMEAWRTRAEEITRRYQELLQTYGQLKSSTKNEVEWRRRCGNLVNGTLKNCRELEMALAAATAGSGPAGGPADGLSCGPLAAGIRQLVENQLQQLHAEGLLDLIEPQPSELFNPGIHEAVGTKPCTELAEGLIAAVAAAGYACAGKTVRKAKVILAAPAGASATEAQTPGSNTILLEEC